MPNLLPLMHSAAPALQIESRPLGDAYLDGLADGSLDFVIYLDQKYPDDYLEHKLFRSLPKFWCRREHPLTRLDVVTLEDIFSYPKIVFDFPSIKLDELTALMHKLKSAEYSNEVMFDTSQLLIALILLNKTELSPKTKDPSICAAT